MDLAERPEPPHPAGWVIAEFTDDGRLLGHLHDGGRVWDDEVEAAAVVERGDRADRPLVLYALVPAWGPVEDPTATVVEPD
ncbi:hypothetical protein GCM10022204_20460 [Microlunatus aurantiacus]|uniref:Uncharacterized protein n=1 Tax=Microlunatus aurantiacus TaxID=446786 RepID=A0ABP7DB73_9ACTN